MSKYPYPLFSLAERDARWARVRAMMAREGFDVIVAPNNSGHSLDFQADSRYLSHVGGGGDTDIACIFPLQGDVTVSAHGNAKERWTTTQDWVTDVRETNRRHGDVIVQRLKELGAERGTIAVGGYGPGNRTPEGTVSYMVMKKMLDAFPNAKFIDCTEQMQEVRSVKSDEEIAFLTKSIEMAEEGINALVKSARPGVRDYEVYAEVVYAMTKRGCELPTHINWISGPPETLAGNITRPSYRIVESGDRFSHEIEGNVQGYRSQAVQPVFVDSSPQVYLDLLEIQKEVFNRIMDALRPGVTVGELLETTASAAKAVVPSTGPLAGCKANLTMHGRGQGDDRPLITRPDNTERFLKLQLEERNVFILKPSVRTADGKSMTWGDTVTIDKQGGRRLGSRPHAIRISGKEE